MSQMRYAESKISRVANGNIQNLLKGVIFMWKKTAYKTRVYDNVLKSEVLKEVEGYTDGTFFYYKSNEKPTRVAAVIIEVGLTLDGKRYRNYKEAREEMAILTTSSKWRKALESDVYKKQKEKYIELICEWKRRHKNET